MMYKRLTADRRDIGLRYAPRPRGRSREGTEAGTNLAAPRHAPRAAPRDTKCCTNAGLRPARKVEILRSDQIRHR
jgi:hypothetical protein